MWRVACDRGVGPVSTQQARSYSQQTPQQLAASVAVSRNRLDMRGVWKSFEKGLSARRSAKSPPRKKSCCVQG